ncbi:MAG: TolC family outer membrane protein [Desulfovibrio sp.]|nr:TolC family outer membrane protein [Desulfovibrio sp.]
MKRTVTVVLAFLLLLASPALAARASTYPPPPKPGQPITVKDTVYGVLRSHRNLRQMQENREVLEHELRRAQAGFGPRVDVTARGGLSQYSDSSTRSQDLDDRMYGMVGLSAQLVQPIWDGFATRSRVRSARATLESQKHRVFDTATSLSLDGIIAHIDLLRRRAIYKLSEENVERHKELVGQAEDRAALGADTAADVTQAQSRMQRALSSLSEAKATLLVAENTYTRLTGLPASAKLQPVTLPPQVYASAAAVLKLAEKSNPKLAAYLQDIRAARAAREQADAAFYPSFSLEAGPNYTNRGGADDRWVYSFDAMGVARWNIFNSGADLAEHRAASARMRQARQVMRNYLDDLKLDVDSTWTNYQAAEEQYKHYAKAIEYNKYTCAAYDEQFQIGKRSILDVLDAQSELYNSSTQAETARGNILVGAYRLSALTGTMLQDMSINLRPLDKKPVRDPADPREQFAPGWFD